MPHLGEEVDFLGQGADLALHQAEPLVVHQDQLKVEGDSGSFGAVGDER